MSLVIEQRRHIRPAQGNTARRRLEICGHVHPFEHIDELANELMRNAALTNHFAVELHVPAGEHNLARKRAGEQPRGGTDTGGRPVQSTAMLPRSTKRSIAARTAGVGAEMLMWDVVVIPT